MRNTLQRRRVRGRRIETVLLAAIAASFWSTMSGTLLVMALEALERLVA
jgi:hypothetical protein